jgi:predicted Zn-dependent protease
MKLIEAVRKKDKAAIQKIVNKAVKVYQASEPEPETANTVFGELDVRMLDKKSKWQIANATLVNIMNAVKCIPEGADRKVETAKIIATSQLRILFDDIDSGNEFL